MTRPIDQVARRVCVTAAGYTLGVATAEGPRLFHGRPPAPAMKLPEATAHVAAPEPVRKPQAVLQPAPQAMRLLALLEELAPSGVLPSMKSLARTMDPHVPDNSAASVTHHRLTTLALRGLIRWHRGEEIGAHAVTLVSTEQTLRSAQWAPGVVL